MRRHILITGANQGIGLAMTRILAEMVDHVAALDLSLENLEPKDPNLIRFMCDVTDAQRIGQVIEDIVGTWGSVDVLINNSCRAVFKPFFERSIEDIRGEFEVNLFGYLNMIHSVLPVMKRQKSGVIHNMSSGVGYTGMPGMSGYTASKGDIESLTRMANRARK